MSHTPIPWEVNFGMRPPRIWATSAPETTICDMANWCIDHWDERAANAALIVKAVNNHARLVAALDGLVLVCGRTGDALTDFEEQATAFYRETGLMRPGKDTSAAGWDGTTQEQRRDRYSKWVESKIAEGRAALAALAATEEV